MSDAEESGCYQCTHTLATSPASGDPTLLSSTFETAATELDLISHTEGGLYYTGISEKHPVLFHRSDLQERPFIISTDRFATIPEKTIHSANHPVLKQSLWKKTVAPEIAVLLEDPTRSVQVSIMLPVRFSTRDEDGRAVLDNHIVLMIAVHPNTTKETSCRDANASIISILAKHGIHDAAVHWIEDDVEFLGGPPMMGVVSHTNPTHYIRRALTPLMGLSLAAEVMREGDVPAWGQEEEDTTLDYEYRGFADAPKQFIRNCGGRRFQRVIDETLALTTKRLGDAKLLAEQVQLLEPKSEEEEEDKQIKEQDLERAKKDVVRLDDFFKLLTSAWSDASQRIVGHLDWAPKISSDLDDRHYTRDLGVIALDEDVFDKSFKGNVVYLAGKYTHDEIDATFNPRGTNPHPFTYPVDHLFRLVGHVDEAGMANPSLLDENGKPGFIVAKFGQTTDLTFGRLSELEAYHRDNSGHSSWEVAVLNFSSEHGNFADKGDSGSAIFNAEGKLVAILHSGGPRGKVNWVTFGTPAHYVVELVKGHYPHADFEISTATSSTLEAGSSFPVPL